MKRRILALMLCLLLLAGCSSPDIGETQASVPTLGDDNTSFGEEIEDSGIFDGLFEEINTPPEVVCLSGTPDAYKLEGSTLTFTGVDQETAYAITGQWKGNIVIDVGMDYKFELEFQGFSLICEDTNPITIVSGDEVTLKAKKDTKNYIYDRRPAGEEVEFSGAIHAEVDLEIAGKGELTVSSDHYNGIHTKDDLQVKNLTLLVACVDNGLKGNDGVEITDANTTIIASMGDGIKTTNSDISAKGNQRGTITITGGSHTIYAACDGLDAAYDVVIQGETTVVNIYTDKYSNYSQEVTAPSSDTNFIRFTNNQYSYSVKYYNSETDYVWVNAQYHSMVSGGTTNYYYYSYPKMANYAKQQFFIYESADQQGQETAYLVKSDYLTPNPGSDTFALSSSYNGLYYEWTNYTTKIQGTSAGGPGGPGGPGSSGGGPGGFGEGNSDKGDYSTKGIKASNAVLISDGTISIKSYDDAIHAKQDTALENGDSPLGNVTIQGGTVTVYSNDDGIHADGLLSIQGGTVTVSNAYEGLEGNRVEISGGYVSVSSKDDGINATTTSGTAISISGGTVYVYCTGDGIDSNSRTSGTGIVFSGGRTVVISNSGMNSSLDTENGYTHTGGQVVAIMPRGGMSNEATHCVDFNKVGKAVQMSLTKDQYLVVGIGNATATIRLPLSLSAQVVILGDTAPNVRTESSTDLNLDSNGVAWK